MQWLRSNAGGDSLVSDGDAGPGTDRNALAELMHHVRTREPLKDLQLVNYNKSRMPFAHSLSIETIEVRCQANRSR